MTNHRGRQVNPAHQKVEPNARRYALHRFGRGFVGVAACCNASFNCFAQYLEESYWSGSYISEGRKVVLYPCRRMSVPHEKYILEKIVQGFNVLQHPTAARGHCFRFGWFTNRVGFDGECHSGFGFILKLPAASVGHCQEKGKRSEGREEGEGGGWCDGVRWWWCTGW